jgi:hypothetical protein
MGSTLPADRVVNASRRVADDPTLSDTVFVAALEVSKQAAESSGVGHTRFSWCFAVHAGI